MKRKSIWIGCGVAGCLGLLALLVVLSTVGLLGVGGGAAAWFMASQPVVFGEDAPHAVQIAEVRSVHHARQMQERLGGMGVETVVVAVRDSEGAGVWYRVLTGVTDEVGQAYQTRLELEATQELVGLELVNWHEVKHRVIALGDAELAEVERVLANAPQVGPQVVEVVQRYPYSNMLNVERLTVYLSPEDPETTWRYSSLHQQVGTDLPRGTDRVLVLRQTEAWSEAILTDNLYGDQVTLNVLKLKPDHGIEGNVADYYSQRILDTGRYNTELIEPFEVQASERLVGNKVTIESSRGHFRVYVILVDPSQRWVYFSQSTDKQDDELKEVLALIGFSNGMFEYSEFVNTFNTIPDVREEGDDFLGFNMDRIRPVYAVNKGNVQWAKQCVGHWSAQGFFFNEETGPWSFGIFDLLTDPSAGGTYDLYGELADGPKPLEVYGTDGWVVREQRWNARKYKVFEWPSEVNFRQGRYICMVNNAQETGWLEQEGLVARANSLQLQSAGGYR